MIVIEQFEQNFAYITSVPNFPPLMAIVMSKPEKIPRTLTY